MACGKCGKEQREQGQRWCPGCQASYMREYRKTTKTREVRNAKRQGAEEFRAAAVAAFRRIGEHNLNGFAAARLLAEQIII